MSSPITIKDIFICKKEYCQNVDEYKYFEIIDKNNKKKKKIVQIT